MAEEAMPAGVAAFSDVAKIRFRLYVAGRLPNSLRAIVNLTTFCDTNLRNRHDIEVVDVFDVPGRAMEDRILLTPQLIVGTGLASQRIVGELSDAVLSAAVQAAAVS